MIYTLILYNIATTNFRSDPGIELETSRTEVICATIVPPSQSKCLAIRSSSYINSVGKNLSLCYIAVHTHTLNLQYR